MSENNQELPSPTDTRNSLAEIKFPNTLTVFRKTLKDNLNPKVSYIIKVLDLVTNSTIVRFATSSTVATPPITILNERGRIDVNKFFDTIIQSNNNSITIIIKIH